MNLLTSQKTLEKLCELDKDDCSDLGSVASNIILSLFYGALSSGAGYISLLNWDNDNLLVSLPFGLVSVVSGGYVLGKLVKGISYIDRLLSKPKDEGIYYRDLKLIKKTHLSDRIFGDQVIAINSFDEINDYSLVFLNEVYIKEIFDIEKHQKPIYYSYPSGLVTEPEYSAKLVVEFRDDNRQGNISNLSKEKLAFLEKSEFDQSPLFVLGRFCEELGLSIKRFGYSLKQDD